MTQPTQLSYFPWPLVFKPGVNKDTTALDNDYYLDAVWARFFEGRPSKIGGYYVLQNGIEKVVRVIASTDLNNKVYVYFGYSNVVGAIEGVTVAELDRSANLLNFYDITPADFESDENGSWSFTFLSTEVAEPYPDETNGQYLFAVATQTAIDPANSQEGPLYYHKVGTNDILAPVVDQSTPSIGPIMASGGVTYVNPLLMVWGNNGYVQWPNPFTGFQDWSQDTHPYATTIATTKILQVQPSIGGEGINAIFWAPPELIQATFVANTVFSESTLTGTPYPGNISVLSSLTVLQYENQFFWLGDKEFYQFAGISKRLENNMSTNYFFDNLNYDYIGKVTGAVMPRFAEMWWYWPDLTSLNGEPNNVLMMSLNTNTFSNIKINRSVGISPSNLRVPIMCSSVVEEILTPTGPQYLYPIWAHESGTDKVINDIPVAIKSSVTTPLIYLAQQDSQVNRMIQAYIFEPDFIRTGPMNLYVYTRQYAQSEPKEHGPFLLTPTTTHVDLDVIQAKYVNFKYESHTVGGYFKTGRPQLGYYIGDPVE